MRRGSLFVVFVLFLFFVVPVILNIIQQLIFCVFDVELFSAKASALGNHQLMQLLAQSRANFFGDARAQEGRASHAACRNGCGARVAPKLLDLHEKKECSKRIVSADDRKHKNVTTYM